MVCEVGEARFLTAGKRLSEAVLEMRCAVGRHPATQKLIMLPVVDDSYQSRQLCRTVRPKPTGPNGPVASTHPLTNSKDRHFLKYVRKGLLSQVY